MKLYLKHMRDGIVSDRFQTRRGNELSSHCTSLYLVERPVTSVNTAGGRDAEVPVAGQKQGVEETLPYYGKRKIVAIATFVTRPQVSAEDSYDRLIRDIGKGPGDRCGRGVTDDSEGGSYGESAL